MKIILTGGGSGGHFYSLIAIAESVKKLSTEKKLISPELFFFAPNPYNEGMLYDHNIEFKKTSAGKIRRYFSIMNFFDLFKTAWGVLSTTLDVFSIYPDVVFGKGGYGSFPTLMAARLLRIPVVIHESDSVPGRVNKWAGKFATRIAVSYKEAAKYFPEGKVAFTGQPILKDKEEPITDNASEYFGFDKTIPTILILGGSLGAEIINNAIMDALPKLVEKYQIIHQTGQGNINIIKETASSILLDNRFKKHYKPYGYLNSFEMKMAPGAADIVISRAGSTIFEIASWGKPSIIIPISDSNGNHQVKNAFNYASSGACSVIQESNLTTNILITELNRILSDSELKEKMISSAKNFWKPGASDTIAKEILSIALSHEKLDKE